VGDRNSLSMSSLASPMSCWTFTGDQVAKEVGVCRVSDVHVVFWQLIWSRGVAGGRLHGRLSVGGWQTFDSRRWQTFWTLWATAVFFWLIKIIQTTIYPVWCRVLTLSPVFHGADLDCWDWHQWFWWCGTSRCYLLGQMLCCGGGPYMGSGAVMRPDPFVDSGTV